MKRILFIFFLFFFFTSNIYSANGDTTWITGITGANMASPPSNDDNWVVLPQGSVSYSKIIMKFTLGCGIPDCSHWDYTVNASIGKKSGTLDSTIAIIDTISHNPLVLDTNWNVFEVVNFFEIGRLITPYGTYMDQGTNGFNSQWNHPYYYDVTDFASLLKDSTMVRIGYSGWSDAFSGKIEFMYVEGPPSRNVSSIHNLYSTYASYPNSLAFESVIAPKSIAIPSGTSSAKVHVIITGHESYGEFVPHDLHLKVNGAEIATRLVWKDNCGSVAVYPQGGTWIFNRANWCPGEGVPVIEFDVTNFITAGQNATIDLDMDDFVLPSGEGAGYGIQAYLITYSSQFDNDVMMEEIIAPNSDKSNLRFNPICANPKVKIKNMGKSNLTYAEISYWVKGGNKCYYEWNGILQPFQSQEISLPSFDWSGLDTSDRVFYAEAKWPNQTPDEYETNNKLQSSFNLPPIMDSTFKILLKTNNKPNENAGGIKDENGNWVFQHPNPLTASFQYNDLVSLAPGCYVYELTDYDPDFEGGDGLSWWFNTQQNLETAGSLQFRKASNNQLIRIFNADFGSMVRYEFMVGYPLSFGPPKTPCTPPVHVDIPENINGKSFMDIIPNPSNGKFMINYALKNASDYNDVQVFDIFGAQVYNNKLFYQKQGSIEVNLTKQPAGIYFVVIRNPFETLTQKVIIR